MNIIWRFLVLAALLSSSSYSRAQSRVVAPTGTWFCRNAFIIEPAEGETTWQLNADGTYVIGVRSKEKTDKALWQEKGTWTSEGGKIARHAKSWQHDTEKPEKLNGSESARQTYELSGDGSTLTFTDHNLVFVFKRVSPSGGLQSGNTSSSPAVRSQT